MRATLILIITLLFIGTVQGQDEVNKIVLFDSVMANSRDSLEVFIKDDLLTFKYKDEQLSTPWMKGAFHPEAILGIYFKNKDGVKNYQSIEVNEKIFFVLQGENYWGELYVIDKIKNDFVVDGEFERYFLVSPSGIYFVNPSGNSIFVVDRPKLNEKQDVMESAIFLYTINNGFKLSGDIVEKGELIYELKKLSEVYRKHVK